MNFLLCLGLNAYSFVHKVNMELLRNLVVSILFAVFCIFFGSSNFYKYSKGTTIFIENEEEFDQSFLPTLTLWVKQGREETNRSATCINRTSEADTITCLQESFVNINWNLSNIELFTVGLIDDSGINYSFKHLDKQTISKSYGLALNGLKLHINNSNNIFNSMNIGIYGQEKVDLVLHDGHFFIEDTTQPSNYGMQQISAHNSKTFNDVPKIHL